MAIAQLKKSLGNADQIVYANASGSTMTAGRPYLVEISGGATPRGLCVIPLADIATSTSGVCYIDGEFTVDKGSNAFSAGEAVYFDVSETQADNAATATANRDFVIGMATEAAGASTEYVDVLLNRGPSAYVFVSA